MTLFAGFIASSSVDPPESHAAPDASPESYPDRGLKTEYFFEAEAHSRRLRGDWEGADVVVLTFTDNWQGPTHRIGELIAAHRGAQTQFILLHDGVSGERRAARAAVHWRQQFGVESVVLPTAVDTPWIRDYGPLLIHGVASHLRHWLDYDYGTLRLADDRVWSRSSEALNLPVLSSSLRFEGGAIASNGQGVCVSTVQFFTEHELWPLGARGLGEQTPAVELGCPHLLLVPALSEDDTEHADMFLQFVSPNHAWLAEVDLAEDPVDARRLNATAQALQELSEDLDWPLRITRSQLPRLEDNDHYTSYINALRIADLLVLPSYSSVPAAREQEIHAQIQRDFPGLRVVTVQAEDMAMLGGAVHCMTLALDWPGQPFENPV